jgi:16S rRNA (cytosine967-C5)-methyltransferase
MSSEKKYNVREMALHVLHSADTKKSFSDKLLESLFSRSNLDKRDKDFLTMLVKGTLRRRGTIDWVLDRYIQGGVAGVPAWARNALRLGAFQILYMDRVPPSAATNESVNLVSKYGNKALAGLTNAVLRKCAADKDNIRFPDRSDDPVESISIEHSHPKWLVKRWVARLGVEETAALCAANNDISHVDLRANLLKTTPARVAEALENQGLDVERGRLNPQILRVRGEISVVNMDGFRRGFFTIQDESESLVSLLLAPHPGERALDLCAAPGGKASHIYELMKGIGVVVAVDISPGRIRSLAGAISRLGCEGVLPVVADGREFASLVPFHKVLVDAPCSGLGVLGKKADARWRKTPDSFEFLSALQFSLLMSGADHVAKGGALVYSVCTTEPEETDEVARKFLEQRPDFVQEDAGGLLPADVVERNGTMRTYPHRHGIDGAFAVRFIRK